MSELFNTVLNSHSGDLERAEIAFLHMLEDVEDHDTLFALGELYLDRREYPRAENYFSKAACILLSAKSLNQIGICNLRRGDTGRAIGFFRQALKCESGNYHVIWYNLAVSYFDLGHKFIAKEQLKQALRLKPDFECALKLMKEIDK